MNPNNELDRQRLIKAIENSTPSYRTIPPRGKENESPPHFYAATFVIHLTLG
jgi:hypothetical protein